MIQATCKDGQAFIIVYSHGDGPPETVIMQHLHDIIHSRDPPEDKEDLPFVIVATKCDREGKDRAILTYALQSTLILIHFDVQHVSNTIYIFLTV